MVRCVGFKAKAAFYPTVLVEDGSGPKTGQIGAIMMGTTERRAEMNKALKVILGVVLAAVLVVALYVGYVMVSYYRLDDNLTLEADAPLGGTPPAAQINLAENPQLKVVTANLGFGAYNQDFDFFMDGGSGSVAASPQVVEDDIKGEGEAIKALSPTFVLFQEVDVRGTRSHFIDQYEMLRKLFPYDVSVFAQNYDSPFLMWPLYAPHGANKAGLATFSQYKVDSALRRSLPISDSFSKFLDLDRCYSICRIPVSNGKQLVLMNVHLSAYGADESIMAAQRRMLFADMEAELAAGNYVIAGGDFNHDMIGVSGEVYHNKVQVVESWAKPFDFDSVPFGFTVAAKAKYDAGQFDDAATCRDAGRPYDGTNDRWVMDTFIYSSNIECLDYSTVDLDFAYSDHNPAQMTFQLGE